MNMKRKRAAPLTALAALAVAAILVLPAAQAEHEQAQATWSGCESDCTDEFLAWMDALENHGQVSEPSQASDRLTDYQNCITEAEADYGLAADIIVARSYHPNQVGDHPAYTPESPGPSSETGALIIVQDAGSKLVAAVSVCNTLFLAGSG